MCDVKSFIFLVGVGSVMTVEQGSSGPHLPNIISQLLSLYRIALSQQGIGLGSPRSPSLPGITPCTATLQGNGLPSGPNQFGLSQNFPPNLPPQVVQLPHNPAQTITCLPDSFNPYELFPQPEYLFQGPILPAPPPKASANSCSRNPELHMMYTNAEAVPIQLTPSQASELFKQLAQQQTAQLGQVIQHHGCPPLSASQNYRPQQYATVRQIAQPVMQPPQTQPPQAIPQQYLQAPLGSPAPQLPQPQHFAHSPQAVPQQYLQAPLGSSAAQLPHPQQFAQPPQAVPLQYLQAPLGTQTAQLPQPQDFAQPPQTVPQQYYQAPIGTQPAQPHQHQALVQAPQTVSQRYLQVQAAQPPQPSAIPSQVYQPASNQQLPTAQPVYQVSAQAQASQTPQATQLPQCGQPAQVSQTPQTPQYVQPTQAVQPVQAAQPPQAPLPE